MSTKLPKSDKDTKGPQRKVVVPHVQIIGKEDPVWHLSFHKIMFMQTLLSARVPINSWDFIFFLHANFFSFYFSFSFYYFRDLLTSSNVKVDLVHHDLLLVGWINWRSLKEELRLSLIVQTQMILAEVNEISTLVSYL